MKNTKRKLLLSVVPLAGMALIVGIGVGCGQSSKPSTTLSNERNLETGRVSVSIAWPRAKNIQALAIPTSAVTISLTASAEDMAPVSVDIDYPQTIGTLEVKIGDNRIISAVAKNGSGQIVATGEVAGLNVVLGINNPVNMALTAVSGRSYFPANDGYSWQWNYPSLGILCLTVEGTKQIDSTTAQTGKLTVVFGGSTGTSETYWKIDDTGVYYYASGSTSEAFAVLKFPLAVGETWECEGSYGSYYSTTVTVVAYEKATVPAGTFDCYKVCYEAAGGYTYYWFGDGVGAVKARLAGSTDEIVLAWKNF